MIKKKKKDYHLHSLLECEEHQIMLVQNMSLWYMSYFESKVSEKKQIQEIPLALPLFAWRQDVSLQRCPSSSLYQEGERLIPRDNFRPYQPGEGTRRIFITLLLTSPYLCPWKPKTALLCSLISSQICSLMKMLYKSQIQSHLFELLIFPYFTSMYTSC